MEIQPAGDRLEGAPLRELPPVLDTSSDGYLAFLFPKWTHVRLVSASHEIHYDWPIPDYVRHMVVMAAPRDRLALKVRMPAGRPLPDSLWFRRPGRILAFDRLRGLADGGGVYVANRDGAPGTAVGTLDGGPGLVELDLSGGWCDPLDLRPEPEARKATSPQPAHESPGPRRTS